jgi:hypothetical protein
MTMSVADGDRERARFDPRGGVGLGVVLPPENRERSSAAA